MKKIISIAAMVAMGLFFGVSTSQAWMFDIDNSSGNVFDINFIADGDTVLLDGYTLVFDYAGANLISGVETPPAPLGPLFGPFNDIGGTVDFTGTVFFGPGATLSSNVTLASFTFDNPASLAWNEASPAMVATIAGVDLNGIELALNNHLANTSAVPVPGAVWLLGSGLTGLIALRRKNS